MDKLLMGSHKINGFFNLFKRYQGKNLSLKVTTISNYQTYNKFNKTYNKQNNLLKYQTYRYKI